MAFDSNNDNDQDARRRTVRSFVRREGRITPGQKRAVDELLPQLTVDASVQPLDAVALFGRDAPLTVEIGFGDGGSLVQMAAAEPDVNFIGAEVYRPGVGKLLMDVNSNELSNVRVYADDAIFLLEQLLAPASVDRVLVYFPDPWPKKKHLKRRLIQDGFATLVASRLKPGGMLHVATDIESYAEQVLEILEASTELENSTGAGLYAPRPQWRPETKFERRGTRLGHSVWDLLYHRKPAS